MGLVMCELYLDNESQFNLFLQHIMEALLLLACYVNHGFVPPLMEGLIKLYWIMCVDCCGMEGLGWKILTSC